MNEENKSFRAEDLYELASQKEEKVESLWTSSNVQAYVRELQLADGPIKIRKEYLYASYKLWCDRNKLERKKYHEFFKHLYKFSTVQQGKVLLRINRLDISTDRSEFFKMRAFVLEDMNEGVILGITKPKPKYKRISKKSIKTLSD